MIVQQPLERFERGDALRKVQPRASVTGSPLALERLTEWYRGRVLEIQLEMSVLR
jgi:hypothetical protein